MTKIPVLFKIMKEKGITQKQLAANIGTSQGNIADWKSGKSAPSIDKLPLIANYLDVSVDYLLGRPERSEPAAPELAPEYQEIVELYQDLTPEQQSLIKATMQSWLAVNDTAAIEKKKDV